ncbi:hypothetical protein KUCAC02_005555 [Chaenocephalus aceratus]|uniref:Uncharacterized protein n=1 Tax=Chaenocephalus aceratus TaxID=36190 RepID=A0ACB9WNZ4_CHAAC|nr:hypothetical protein KUCAC02_005555 [Chaenocephalus aceratus]
MSLRRLWSNPKTPGDVNVYSTGKTTFIRYLIEQDFPWQQSRTRANHGLLHTALMHGEVEGIIPGNALTVDPKKPFRNLDPFGNAFLNRFQCVQMPNKVLESVSIIDHAGHLNCCEKKNESRLRLPSKFSDELTLAFGALCGHEDKLRVVLNKADRVDSQAAHEKPRQACDHYQLIEVEEEGLLADIRTCRATPRARVVRAHAHIISYLKKEMPTIFCKESKKSSNNIESPAGDFPDCTKMQEKLLGQGFSQSSDTEAQSHGPRWINSWPLTSPTWRDDESGEADFVEWAVEKYKPKYDEIFYNLSPNDGKLSGTKVREWMSTTLLPSSVLAHIWRLSDVDGDGMLDNEEFALAVHLIEGKLEDTGSPESCRPTCTASDEEQT